VLNQMDEHDRDAILLRFFDGESFGEVGAKLRLSENAARMRVEFSTVESFRTILGAASADALTDRDLTARLKPDNLPAGQDIYATNRLVDLLTGPLRDPGRAAVELRRLIERHPESTAATHARAALARIKQRIAESQLDP